MPNISTSNRNTIYKYTGSITTLFKEDTEPLIINSLRLKSIVIDYSYDKNNFPLIYATVALTHEMMNKLKDNLGTGTVLLHIQKYVENSNMPGLLIDAINAECTYFMSNDMGKEREQAIDPDRTEDYGYIVTIGFIAVDHINRNKTAINGVINTGTMSAALYYVLQGHNLLMEPLTYNSQLKSIFLPPMKSVASTVKHLNSISVFYDTPYRFFMDFDTTYLISSSGKGLPKKGDLINTVRVLLVKEYNESNMEGMLEDTENAMYILQVSATFATLMKSELTDKSYSSISGVSTQGTKESAELTEANNSTVIKANTSNIRIPNGNVNLIKNMQAATLNNNIVMGITKNKIDSSVFTINRIYNIITDDVYGTEYSGDYLLASKKEVYAQEGEGLALAVLLTFKKLATS